MNLESSKIRKETYGVATQKRVSKFFEGEFLFVNVEIGIEPNLFEFISDCGRRILQEAGPTHSLENFVTNIGGKSRDDVLSFLHFFEAFLSILVIGPNGFNLLLGFFWKFMQKSRKPAMHGLKATKLNEIHEGIENSLAYAKVQEDWRDRVWMELQPPHPGLPSQLNISKLSPF